MSGHSKWATIKRQKGASDIKRGAQFTKLVNAILIAIRQNGGNTDPESNFKLRLAMDKARVYNMPKDNIERAILKGKGETELGDLHFALYEGFAPGGAAILIEAVTNNKQRTVSEIKNVLEKSGGSLASQGGVSYLFEHIGEIAALAPGKTADDIFNIAVDLESRDYFEEEKDVIFYVDAKNLFSAKKKLEEKGMSVSSAELIYKPLNLLNVETENRGKLLSLVGKLEDLEDVQNVFLNVSLL